MRILVAPDKFKGSLGAADVAQQIAVGLREVLRDAQITLLPIADGGEGTAEVICGAAGGEWHECEAHDALGRIVRARYCTIANGATAVMEMSEASGLWRVAPAERDPITASSFGTGEMVLDAARRGASEIIIGLGGSATNDGGFGFARALGFRFLDARGLELHGDTLDLLRLARIEPPAEPLRCTIAAAADVRNPLLGSRGATRTFGRQKGATPQQLEQIEEALTRFADVAAASVGFDHRHVAGAGAAGGLGFALVAFCGAAIRSGFDVVAERVGLEAAVREADVVITGEGRLDAQTLDGKAPAGVAQLARRFGKRTCAIVGGSDDHVAGISELFDEIVVLQQPGMDVAEAVRDAPRLLRDAGRELGRRYLRS